MAYLKPMVNQVGLVNFPDTTAILRRTGMAYALSRQGGLRISIEAGGDILVSDQSNKIIEYFVNGIPDTKSNKALLYQARSMNQLKAQIGVQKNIRITSTKMKMNHIREKSSRRLENALALRMNFI